MYKNDVNPCYSKQQGTRSHRPEAYQEMQTPTSYPKSTESESVC